ncbi:MAG: hypothetical protein ACYC5S_05295 [Thiobacillus sp.]
MRAPQIAAEGSPRFGVEAQRTGAKHRKPDGVPDAGEARPGGAEKRLAADYPHHGAAGYPPGMLRGIVSIKRAL